MTSRIARKQALWISPMGALAIALSLVSVADAADTTQIPDKPTSPINLLDNETYDFGGRTAVLASTKRLALDRAT